MNIRQTASLAVCSLVVLGGVLGLAPASLRSMADAQSPDTEPPSSPSPEVYQGSFYYSTAAQMLAALQVAVYPEDRVEAFPDPNLGIGSRVTVYRAQPVSITDAGTTRLVRTWSATVGDVLAEQRIELGDKDKVEPSLDRPITPGAGAFSIQITRVAQSTVTTAEPVAFTTTYTDDNTLEKGKTDTDQVGQKGVLTKVYAITRENGAEVSRVLASKTVTRQPINQVVRRGTKVVDYGSGQASWYGGVGVMTAAHRTLPMGTMVKVTNTSNGESVVVRISDRGPFIAGRIIDLSKDAFARISSLGSGVASVKIEQAD